MKRLRMSPVAGWILTGATLLADWGSARGGDPEPASSEPPSLEKTLETGVLRELNQLRVDPAGYAPTLEALLALFDGDLLRLPGEVALRTREGRRAVEEAIAALKTAAPVPRLERSPGMSLAAAEHAADLGRTGDTGHIGSDGASPSKRLRRHGRWKVRVGENISLGEATARRVIQNLVVDDGVPERSHRQSLLNPDFRVAGVACGPHPVYRQVCIIDLAGGFSEPVSTPK